MKRTTVGDVMLNKEADQAGPGPLASILRFRDHEKSAAVTAGKV